MSRPRVDFKYSPPKILISRELAIKRGREVAIRAGVAKDSRPISIRVIYTIPNDEFQSGKGWELSQKHISRLCFWIDWPVGTTNIDVETGECLGGYLVH